MKKKWLELLTLLCAGSMALGFAACGEKENSSSTGSGVHEHVFGEWSQTEPAHVKVCACGEEVEEVHTHDDKGQCTVCGVWDGTDGLSYNLLRVDDEYVYEVAGKGIATETDIVIPSFYDGKRVTSIGSHAFDEVETSYALTSIVIPDSVTDVRDYAFNHCGSLTSIVIPNTVISIGRSAFDTCSGLAEVTFAENSQLSAIGENAFYNCKNLTSISIPSKVTAIAANLFDDCEKLTSVSIPNGITAIGNYAFRNCGDLTDIIIPKTVVTIGANAFADCNKLKIVTIEDDSQLTTISECAFYQCMLLENVVFGKNSRLTTIGERAFYRCNKLVNITLPDSVTFKGEDAFFKDSNGGNDENNGWTDFH